VNAPVRGRESSPLAAPRLRSACIVAATLAAALPATERLRASESASHPGPIQIRYTLPVAGKVAIAIDDLQGRRIRNLLAEAERKAGENVEEWDGRDDRGRLVPPGGYAVSGAVTPPLGLEYQFTLYNGGNPTPWWRIVDNGNPMREKGGWLGDHSPPTDVAAIDETVFIASDAVEHGNSLNAIDLDGKQAWATRWLGLTGARLVASDGRWVYVAGEGAWAGNNFKLFVISPWSFESRELAGFNYDKPIGGRSAGSTGLAARGETVAIAFDGPLADGLTSSFAAADLDLANTTLFGLNGTNVAGILRAEEPKQPWVNWPLPAGEGTAVRIAWREPRRVGAVFSPHRLEVATLKPEAAFPGDLADDAQWEPLEPPERLAAMNVFTAPGGRSTRAVRVRVLDTVAARNWTQPFAAPTAAAAEEPPKFLTGLQVVEPAVRGLSAAGTTTASAGETFADGAWENIQLDDITAERPASYTLTLAEPATARALVIRDPLFRSAEVEIQSRPDGPWIRAGTLEPAIPWRRGYTTVIQDFHRDYPVAAVRLTVTKPVTTENADMRKRTAGRGNVCGLGGLLLLGSGTGDPPIPPQLGQRISLYATDDGRLLEDIPISHPAALEFDSDGRLLAVSDGQIVRVPLGGGSPEPVITEGLGRPAGLTVDAEGRIYVADDAAHVVRRFTPDGRADMVIGTPGGIDLGPYDPERMSHPRGLAIDTRGRLWVAEHEYRPKKVSVWSVAGDAPKLEKFYLGPSPYGGGFMYPDPRNPSRFFFQGMEFEADWRTGASRIKNISWRPGRGQCFAGASPDRPIVVDGRLYLVSEPHVFYGNSFYTVARYDADRGIAIPVAAAGAARGSYSMQGTVPFPALEDPAILAALGNPNLDGKTFIWSDLDGDGRVQATEIELSADHLPGHCWHVRAGDDLTLQFPTLALPSVRFTPAGVPVYSFADTRPSPPIVGPSTVAYGDNYHGMGLTGDDRIIELSGGVSVRPRTEQASWTYPAPWPGTQMAGQAPPPRDGLVAGQYGVIGKAVVPEVGELFAFVADKGEIYVFTTDGLFVARLFRDKRYGKAFNFPEAKRGMEVGGVSINGEHFGGTFTQMSDGRILLVVGHNHNSVVEVKGLEGIRRFSSRVEISPEQRLAAERRIVAQRADAPVKSLAVPQAGADMRVDGALADWPAATLRELRGAGDHAGRVGLAWDPQRLWLAFEVRGRPDLENGGDDWKLLFKSGDSVDLQIGTDPSADPARADPVAGDVRLSFSRFEGKPIAVLYRYRVPDAAGRQPVTFASPVGSVVVDAVEQVPAVIEMTRTEQGYIVEATVEWKALHAKAPAIGRPLRGDLGILFAADGGGAVSERLYWSNRDSGLVMDVPGEIRIKPSQWGTLSFEPKP
jgi:hypothetical protein